MTHDHVSELAIDRLLAGELPSAAATTLRDHAAACLRCGALLDEARAGQRAFALDRPRLQVPVPLRRRRAPLVSAGAVAALAAVLAIAVVWPRTRADREDRVDRVRTKGSAIVGFFVAHGDEVRRGAMREVVVPGDRIELFTTTTEPVWFAAFSDDANGARSTYVAPRALAPGREQVAPTSIELDGALGPAAITGVFCSDAFDAAAIDVRAPPEGCTIDRVELVVVPR